MIEVGDKQQGIGMYSYVFIFLSIIFLFFLRKPFSTLIESLKGVSCMDRIESGALKKILVLVLVKLETALRAGVRSYG